MFIAFHLFVNTSLIGMRWYCALVCISLMISILVDFSYSRTSEIAQFCKDKIYFLAHSSGDVRSSGHILRWHSITWQGSTHVCLYLFMQSFSLSSKFIRTQSQKLHVHDLMQWNYIPKTLHPNTITGLRFHSINTVNIGLWHGTWV